MHKLSCIITHKWNNIFSPFIKKWRFITRKPIVYPTSGRFGRGESMGRGENRRAEWRFASSATGQMLGERSPPRHQTKGVRGRASLEHKGGREEPRRRIRRRISRRHSTSAEAAAARASRKTWKSEEDGGSQFCLVGPVSLGREADARENH